MKYIFLLLCLCCAPLWAEIPPGQWQCFAFDEDEISYEALGMSMKQAMQRAVALCKSRSKQGRACKTAQSFCEQGPLSLIENRCVVTDEAGRTWNTTGMNACKTALELCNNWQFLHGNPTQCSVKHH